MQPLEIKQDIYCLAAVDWNSRDFHGYSRSPMGTTYNAYLVKDEKIALFDTVKAEFAGSLLCGIAHLTDLEKVDYIIANHMEPDHAGALPRLIEACKPEKIFCSPMGERTLKAHMPEAANWPLEVVKDGDSLSLGKRTVRFYETRMLHWPDSMFSYLEEDQVLICNDAFGQNIASVERYTDEMDPALVEHAAREYYANIVNPYAQVVKKTLNRFAEAGLAVDVICPDHGLMWRGAEAAKALELYAEYAEQKPTAKAVIFYDTMWHSTEKLAYAIAEGCREEDLTVRIMALKANHHSAVQTEIFDAGAVIVGSPTHNNGILPNVAKMLTYMKGLRPQNKVGAAFGSFGWSGESVKMITEWLESMNIELPVEAVKCKHVPTHEAYKQAVELGRAVGKAVKAKL